MAVAPAAVVRTAWMARNRILASLHSKVTPHWQCQCCTLWVMHSLLSRLSRIFTLKLFAVALEIFPPIKFTYRNNLLFLRVHAYSVLCLFRCYTGACIINNQQILAYSRESLGVSKHICHRVELSLSVSISPCLGDPNYSVSSLGERGVAPMKHKSLVPLWPLLIELIIVWSLIKGNIAGCTDSRLTFIGCTVLIGPQSNSIEPIGGGQVE